MQQLATLLIIRHKASQPASLQSWNWCQHYVINVCKQEIASQCVDKAQGLATAVDWQESDNRLLGIETMTLCLHSLASLLWMLLLPYTWWAAFKSVVVDVNHWLNTFRRKQLIRFFLMKKGSFVLRTTFSTLNKNSLSCLFGHLLMRSHLETRILEDDVLLS